MLARRVRGDAPVIENIEAARKREIERRGKPLKIPSIDNFAHFVPFVLIKQFRAFYFSACLFLRQFFWKLFQDIFFRIRTLKHLRIWKPYLASVSCKSVDRLRFSECANCRPDLAIRFGHEVGFGVRPLILAVDLNPVNVIHAAVPQEGRRTNSVATLACLYIIFPNFRYAREREKETER